MKVAAVIQARMGSTRYPGKVLETISNHPVLYHVIERIRESQYVDVIVLATTTENEDKLLLKRAREFQIHGFAGSQYDLIKRFVAAAHLVAADIIVRVPCDNPIFEPSFIDDCVSLLKEKNADYCYVENAVLGTGVDVFTEAALVKADEEATESHHREHIITYFKDNPDKFNIVTIKANQRYVIPELRLTFDTKEDLKLIRTLYHKFFQEDSTVSLVKVINFLKQNPEIAGLNAEVIQKSERESELAAIAEAERRAAEAKKRREEEEAREAEERALEEQRKAEAEELRKQAGEQFPPLGPGESTESEDDSSKDHDLVWENLFKGADTGVAEEEEPSDSAEEPSTEEIPESEAAEEEPEEEAPPVEDEEAQEETPEEANPEQEPEKKAPASEPEDTVEESPSDSESEEQEGQDDSADAEKDNEDSEEEKE